MKEKLEKPNYNLDWLTEEDKHHLWSEYHRQLKEQEEQP